MSKSLKGTKTEANLMTAFAGESQAHTKYKYYASKAKKEGYVQIGDLFEETANNEKEHAKIWFKLLHDGMPDTDANLLDAAEGENYEWTDMYAGFAKVAKKRASTRLLSSSRRSVRLKRATRNATASCSPMSRRTPSLSRVRRSCGSAPTAAIL